MKTLRNAKITQAEADIVYMDFRKAFDSVLHVGLLQKLLNIGVSGSLWQWLRVYLKYRHQCVKIGDCFFLLTYVTYFQVFHKVVALGHYYLSFYQ